MWGEADVETRSRKYFCLPSMAAGPVIPYCLKKTVQGDEMWAGVGDVNTNCAIEPH